MIFNVADSYLTVCVLLFDFNLMERGKMEVIIKEAGNRLDKALADLTELLRSQATKQSRLGQSRLMW